MDDMPYLQPNTALWWLTRDQVGHYIRRGEHTGVTIFWGAGGMGCLFEVLFCHIRLILTRLISTYSFPGSITVVTCHPVPLSLITLISKQFWQFHFSRRSMKAHTKILFIPLSQFINLLEDRNVSLHLRMR